MLFDKTTFSEDGEEVVVSRRRKIIIFLILFLLASAVIYGAYWFESWGEAMRRQGPGF